MLSYDPLAFVLLCDDDREWHLISLWQILCVTVVSSVEGQYNEYVNQQQ